MTEIDMADVFAYIQAESVRQSATVKETVGMVNAWNYAREIEIMSEFNIIYLSQLITGNNSYRRVPAVFNQGQPAINAQLIPNAMRRLVESIQIERDSKTEVEKSSTGVWISSIDFWTKEFLLIHPFADGNGRVASLLWNWMSGTLDSPKMMPYYFGDK